MQVFFKHFSWTHKQIFFIKKKCEHLKKIKKPKWSPHYVFIRNATIRYVPLCCTLLYVQLRSAPILSGVLLANVGSHCPVIVPLLRKKSFIMFYSLVSGSLTLGVATFILVYVANTYIRNWHLFMFSMPMSVNIIW